MDGTASGNAPTMTILVALLVIIALLVLGGAALGLLANVLWLALVGLVIGAVARVLVRDTGGMSILATILAGIVGSLGGGLLAAALHVGGLVEFLLAVAIAAAVVMLVAGRTRRHDHILYVH
jgi:uncharacterized membrane protein YeaQ/YmgE (transglycosylase-associated protein family)